MFAMPSSLRLLALSALTGTVLGSRISLFSDDACQDFDYDLDGPNGYTNGQCSLLSAKGNFSSFKVVRLDRGCAVTVYGPDTSVGICNPKGLLTTDLGDCYNSSDWTYYSIDGCLGREQESSSAANSPATAASHSSTPTASSSTAVPSSSATAISSSQPTASARPTSDTHNASATPSSSTSTISVGAVAGGVVGGIAGLALIIGGAWFLFRRRRRQAHAGAGPTDFRELSGEPTTVEIHGKEVPKRSELPAARAGAELPPHEVAPQELSAEGWRGVGGGRVEKPPY